MNLSNIFIGNHYKGQGSTITIAKDFDIESYCMETMIILEEEFFKINSDNLYAQSIGLSDGDLDILTEGFTDFKDAIVKYFKKFIHMITTIIKNITAFISSYVADFEKFLSDYKDYINKANPDFSIQGHIYTNKIDIPNMSFLTDFVSQFNSKVSKLENITLDDIAKIKETFDNNLPFLRGKLIQESHPLNDGESFRQALKAKLRDGNNTQTDIYVNKSYLSKVVDEYSYVKKYLAKTKSDYEKLLSIMTGMKSFFERSVSVHYEKEKKYIKTNEIKTENKFEKSNGLKYDFTTERLQIANKLFEVYFYQCKKLSNLYAIILQEKITSLKEELNQYRVVVRKSIFTKKSD